MQNAQQAVIATTAAVESEPSAAGHDVQQLSGEVSRWQTGSSLIVRAGAAILSHQQQRNQERPGGGLWGAMLLTCMARAEWDAADQYVSPRCLREDRSVILMTWRCLCVLEDMCCWQQMLSAAPADWVGFTVPFLRSSKASSP